MFSQLKKIVSLVRPSSHKSTPARSPRVRLQVETLESRELLSASLTPLMTIPLLSVDHGTQGTVRAFAAAPAVLQNVLDTKVIAFDVTTTGSLSFNLGTGGYSAKIELPAGVTLNTSALKALMSGQFAVPKVEPVQALSALGGLKTAVSSDYEQVRAGLFKQYGGGNVYMSTLRFTDWASPENVASTIGTGVITGGATSGQIIQEATDVILGELGNLFIWLKNKAPNEAEAAIASALKGIVTGQDVVTPNVSIKFLNVKQTYTIGLGGAAATIASGLGASSSKSVTAVHKGFAVIWKGSGDSLSSLTNSLNKFDGASLSGKSEFGSLIGKLANRPELKGLGKVAEAILTSNPSALADQLVTTKLAAALGLTKAQLNEIYQSSISVMDLRVTQLDEHLAKLLGNLAAGNDGSAQVTKLEFDLNTYEITAQVSVRHRHYWGSVNDIMKAVGKQVGEWADKAGNYVDQKRDTAGNTVRNITYKTGDKVRQIIDKATGSSTFKAVKGAGSTLANVAKNLQGDFGAGLKKIAGTLWDMGGNSRSHVMEALASGIGGKYADMATAVLKGISGTTLANVAYALKNGANITMTSVASALWDMGGNTRAAVLGALSSGIGGKYADMAKAVLKGISGTTLADIAYALKNGANISMTRVASALWDMGGNSRTAVLGALSAGIGGKYVDMANAVFKGIDGTTLANVAYALKNGAKITMTSVASALWDMGGNTRAAVLGALSSGIGGKYADMASALYNGIGGTTLANVAYALKNGAKITMTSVAGALWDMGGNTRSAIAEALSKGIGGKYADMAYAVFNGIGGTDLADVAIALKKGIGLSAGSIAGALWDMGGITRANVVWALIHGIGLSEWKAWSIANSL